ncbi:MAG: hypothetical protein K6T31_03060, partial [Alicyclobacillus sp.]|nr:hypothetical protein [Alicyclobacillus sp.]
SSAVRSFTVQPGAPQVTLTAQGPSGPLAQTSIVINVSGNLKNGTLASPTGYVEIWDSANGAAAQLLRVLQLTPGAAGASVAGTRVQLSSGTHTLHAHYRGDNNWQATDSANQGVAGFQLSLNPNAVSFKGGSPGTTNVTVTPTGGFTGTVTLGCPAGSAFALAGYTCSFNPGQINVTGAGPETVALTLTPTEKVTVFRSVQESLENVRVHAQASQVWITLTYGADQLHVEVRDDGIGLVAAEWGQWLEQGKLGLTLCRQRLSLMGGTFTIEPAAVAGTCVSIRLPLGRGGSA